jgi:hypothetical protein
MYIFWNKLFGWDYIQWSNGCNNGVARVFREGSGKLVYWRYKITKVMDVIDRPTQVRWLTCSPKKYFYNWE